MFYDQLWFYILMFIAGLLLLIKGGDWFVDGSSNLARRMHIPELIVGATIVSIGTTLPEVMVSATAALNGQGSIAYGNAIGSIICNTALIAALTVTIRPSATDRKSLLVPVIFFFSAAAFYILTAIFGSFSRLTGIILIAMFILYAVLIVITEKKKSKMTQQEQEEIDTKLWKDILFLVLGAGFIAVGANWLVHYGSNIAREVGISEAVIALTFVALGTSLPELVTAVTSLIKGHGALSLGNIIGANLFNLVLVSGISVTLSPFEIPQDRMIAGFNSSLIIDIPIMLAVMLILTVPSLIKNKISRWQGILLLSIYAGFCVYQFI